MKQWQATPMQVKRVLAMARAGAYVSVIEKRLGLGRNVLWERIHAGEQPGASSEAALFSEQFRAAEAIAEMRLVRRLVKAAEDDPKWAAHLLERRFPKRWAGRSEEHREKDEPDSKGKAMDLGKARDVARKGRLRAVNGGA